MIVRVHWIIDVVLQEQATFLETLLIVISHSTVHVQLSQKWGYGHAKVGMVVQKFQACFTCVTFSPPPPPPPHF